MKNSFKETNFLINIYKPLGMFRLPRQKTKKIMKHNNPTRQVSMRMFLTLVLIVMSSAFVMAQETYGIKIAGEYITGYNRYDLTEINGVSGKVYFDPNTRTLTLDNATIEADGSNAILNQDCDYLVIELIGTNTINVTNSAGIYLQKETSILGTSGSKLTITSNKGAVLFENSPLEINNCWLEVEGKWGISAGNNVAEEVLKIRNSHVEAKGTSGSICDISGLKLEGSYIYSPSNAAYDADTKSVAVNGVTVKEKVVIEPGYGFKIAGEDVTSLNCKDLSVIDGVDGKISYDPETNTLTMEDVTINTTDLNGIWNKKVKGLKINLVGNNTITSSVACISIIEPSTISGSGTLRLKSSENCGLYLPSSLTVEGVKLYAEGKWGIAGQLSQKSGNVLTIRNAYVEATGSKGSIIDVEDLVLDGSSITQPTGAAFDANVHAVALNGEAVTDKVVVEPDSYGIYIADKPVTTLNYKDLTSIYGVSGSASYDPDTKTLTLDNATIERNSTDGTGIVNKTVSDFTVKLIGKNTVTADLASMVLNQTSTITGDGSLYLTSKRFCGLDMESASVTIDNTSLFVKGGYGIAGFIGAESEVLTVRNSHVEAEGSGSGSITLISNLILDNCAITQPVGAEFDADQRAVVLNGEVFKSKVVIEPVNNSIGTITADVPACKQGIYNLNGVKLTQQWDDLPAGIYIVDGMKRVKN